MSYLYAKGTRVWNNATVQGVSDGGADILTDTGAERRIVCDSVIDFSDMVPNTDLSDALAAAGYEDHAVGDCTEPYNIQRAVLSGNLCARAL